MKLPSLVSPQISRLFSAFLWMVLFAFVTVNVVAISQKQPVPLFSYLPSLSHPFSVESHINTALTLWNQGFQQSAKQEIRIAQDLYNATGGIVLGATSSPSAILGEWESEPQKLKNDYVFWKSVALEKPDYRDGLIMAGLYAYQLGDISQSRGYLKKAYDLDPNYAPLNMLLEKIGK